MISLSSSTILPFTWLVSSSVATDIFPITKACSSIYNSIVIILAFTADQLLMFFQNFFLIAIETPAFALLSFPTPLYVTALISFATCFCLTDYYKVHMVCLKFLKYLCLSSLYFDVPTLYIHISFRSIIYYGTYRRVGVIFWHYNGFLKSCRPIAPSPSKRTPVFCQSSLP